jgi:hypothetical protein
MRRIHVKMIQFGLAFILLASVGMFGAIYVLGGMSGGGGNRGACCFAEE